MTTKAFENEIQLTNNGELSLFFLGVGSAFQKSLYQTNLLLVKGKNHFLIDCGTLCPYVLEKEYNTSISKIDNILITHPHADHIGGLEEFALSGLYVSRKCLLLAVTDSLKKKLWNESLRGGLQFSEYGKMILENYFLQVAIKKIQRKPFEMHEIQFDDLNIKFFRTRHVTSRKNSLRDSQLSYGLIFDDKVLFTGDTQFNPGQLNFLLERYKNIETIFHDCDISGFSSGVHASYEQLKTLPDDIRSKMILCHYDEKAFATDAQADGFAGFVQKGVYYNF